MGVYDRAIATVNRLINKFGQDVLFQQRIQQTPDSTKPWELVDESPNVATIKMVFVDPSSTGISRVGQEFLQFLKGSGIATGVIRGYCAAFNYVPKLNDTFTTINDGNVLIVKGVDKLAPGGITVMYTVEFDT